MDPHVMTSNFVAEMGNDSDLGHDDMADYIMELHNAMDD
jgi:hypothetical protein